MQSINRAQRRRSSREAAKRAQWAALEELTRSRITDWIQDLLEEEVVEFLGRRKSERRVAVMGLRDIATGMARCDGCR